MKGRDLWREPPARWDSGRSALLLNPRLEAFWRELVFAADFPDLPEHVWIATSGTSGRLKVVALSRAAFATSAVAVNKHLSAGPRDSWLNPLPLFHVGGLGIVVRAALSGSRYEFLADWDAHDFSRRVAAFGTTLSSLVPAQVHDLVSARLRCPPSLRGMVVGGGALDEVLRLRAAELGWPLLPSYGLTEACSQVATANPVAQDPAWLPLLDHIEARLGEGGILELRGPSLLTGWMLFERDGSARWEDPKIDGWFRTSDRCELRGGNLRVLGRADDLVKIRGELVDVAALERELQKRVPSGLVRIDVGPDERNSGELTVVAENSSAQAEARGSLDLFPPYAKPSVFRVGAVELSVLGKKIRAIGG
jgi:o-succinylbenzoate---CoA ligase